MRTLTLSIVFVLALAVDVRAQAISARIGTLGPGVEVSLPVSGSISVRAGGSFFALTRSAAADDEDVNVDFEGKVRWGGFRLLSDWHPFNNALRLSGGIYVNLIEVSGEGIPTEPYYLNEGQTNEKVFAPERLGSLSATLTYKNKVSPYAGLGFGDGVRGRRVAFLADVGVAYLGPPTVEMRGTGMISATANQDAQLTEGLSTFRWLPVVSLGIAVRVGGGH